MTETPRVWVSWGAESPQRSAFTFYIILDGSTPMYAQGVFIGESAYHITGITVIVAVAMITMVIWKPIASSENVVDASVPKVVASFAGLDLHFYTIDPIPLIVDDNICYCHARCIDERVGGPCILYGNMVFGVATHVS